MKSFKTFQKLLEDIGNSSSILVPGFLDGNQMQPEIEVEKGLRQGFNYATFLRPDTLKTFDEKKLNTYINKLQNMSFEEFEKIGYYNQNLIMNHIRQAQFQQGLKGQPSATDFNFTKGDTDSSDGNSNQGQGDTTDILKLSANNPNDPNDNNNKNTPWLGNWWGSNPDEWHWRKGGRKSLFKNSVKNESAEFCFFEFWKNIQEIANSASGQGLGLQDTIFLRKSPRESSGTRKGKIISQEPNDHSDMKYVSDNLKYTKVIDKQTKTRVANHHNHK